MHACLHMDGDMHWFRRPPRGAVETDEVSVFYRNKLGYDSEKCRFPPVKRRVEWKQTEFCLSRSTPCNQRIGHVVALVRVVTRMVFKRRNYELNKLFFETGQLLAQSGNLKKTAKDFLSCPVSKNNLFGS